ncbi:glucose 1-dehydrogenase [Caproiciproducens sp.]
MYTEKFDLTGKAAIITGGNKGLGSQITIALAEAGADIAVVARGSCEAVEKVVQECGRKFLGITADLSDPGCADTVINRVLAEFGHIDILVNNAGTTIRKPALEYSPQEWDAILDLNLKSLFFLSQRAAAEFIRQGGGKIISLASLVSFQGGMNNLPYVASKSAVAGITKTMANEWAKYGVQANAIAPGFMRTDLTEEVYHNKERSRQINERIPAGRWGTPEDVGGIAIFLASAASDYINGVTIPVDGGWLGN